MDFITTIDNVKPNIITLAFTKKSLYAHSAQLNSTLTHLLLSLF